MIGHIRQYLPFVDVCMDPHDPFRYLRSRSPVVHKKSVAWWFVDRHGRNRIISHGRHYQAREEEVQHGLCRNVRWSAGYVCEDSLDPRFLTLTVASITATVLYLAETTWFNYIDNFKFVTRVGLHHPIVPTIATILYLIMIYVGPRVMKKREAIELKYIPLVHNIILSSGSLVVTIAILRDVRSLLYLCMFCVLCFCFLCVALAPTQLVSN